MPSCETVGIVGSIVNVIASCQALEILKMVSGNSQAVDRTLRVFELWDNRMRAIRLDHLRDGRDCPTCGAGNYEWLEGRKGSSVAVLCGRNAVQLAFPTRQTVSLQDLERRLAGVGQVARNPFLLRLEVDRYVITVFHDGRAVIGGTADPAEARTVYARYVGL
jgi:adenylyltransferase/sulfurtransferase